MNPTDGRRVHDTATWHVVLSWHDHAGKHMTPLGVTDAATLPGNDWEERTVTATSHVNSIILDLRI